MNLPPAQPSGSPLRYVKPSDETHRAMERMVESERDRELSSLRRVLEAAEDYRESRERWVKVYGSKDSTEDDRAVAFSTRDAMYDAFAAALIRHRTEFPHE